VAGQEAELVELACGPQGRRLLVRLLVDKVGGITIRQCAQINQQISAALEAANLIEESYTVEVSSPGLDRPLVTKRDFERVVGEDVRLDVRIADGRFRETQGMLLAVQPEAIVLKTPGGNVTIPFSDIRLAKKAVRW
jgi:ribosome maturation factor RimP